MKVLLAGVAGFIGSHLADKLIELDYEVVGVDNLSLGRLNNVEHLQENEKFTFVELDFSNYEDTLGLFEDHKFDMVFHLVANSDIRKSSENPNIEFVNTFLPTYNILEGMRIYGVRKLFFSSTSAIYGEKQNVNIVEDIGSLIPISYYGGAKLASEAFISSYAHMNDIYTVVFRFPNVIGNRLTHGVIFDFINKLKKDSNKLEILGDGNQSKPYLHVSDLVEGIILTINSKFNNRFNYFNIGVEDSTSVKKIADIVCELMKLNNVNYNYTGGSIGWKGDVPKFQYDLTKIYSLGWRAKYTSDETVHKTVKEVLGIESSNTSRR